MKYVPFLRELPTMTCTCAGIHQEGTVVGLEFRTIKALRRLIRVHPATFEKFNVRKLIFPESQCYFEFLEIGPESVLIQKSRRFDRHCLFHPGGHPVRLFGLNARKANFQG